MKNVAEHISNTLTNDTAVNALLSGNVYWSRTGENVASPFLIYDVVELKGLSKDRRAYAAVIRCFGENMDAASGVYEAVKTALENAGHDFVTGNSGITDDEYQEAAMELNFNLKNI